MGQAKRVTLERVVNGFIVRWKRPPSPFDADPEERIHICPDLQSGLQMICDEISYAGEERDVSLAEIVLPDDRGLIPVPELTGEEKPGDCYP